MAGVAPLAAPFLTGGIGAGQGSPVDFGTAVSGGPFDAPVNLGGVSTGGGKSINTLVIVAGIAIVAFLLFSRRR